MTRSDALLAQHLLHEHPDLPVEVQDYFRESYKTIEAAYQVSFRLRDVKSFELLGDLLHSALSNGGPPDIPEPGEPT